MRIRREKVPLNSLEDEKFFPKYSEECTHLAAGLLTYTDGEGYCRYNLHRIMRNCLYDAAGYSVTHEVLTELVDAEFIEVRDTEIGWILKIINFRKYQEPRKVDRVLKEAFERGAVVSHQQMLEREVSDERWEKNRDRWIREARRSFNERR